LQNSGESQQKDLCLVDWQEYSMEHALFGEEISDLNRWLLQALA
jgi:predicted esterase